MPTLRSCTIFLCALCLAACADAPTAKAPPTPSRATPARVAAVNLPEIQQAQLKVNEAKKLTGGGAEPERLLNEARKEAALGNTAQARSLAQQAQARAELALDGYYIAASSQELQKLYTYTGLSDAQLARMREAEVALVRGDGAIAYATLQKLNKELTADNKHTVKSGESLWSISARAEVYSNGYLWPLIWDANRDKLKDPNVVYSGQVLRIKPNPTVDEVVKAVEFARAHLGTKVRIGVVREEKP